mgnify:CR=1 FL=1
MSKKIIRKISPMAQQAVDHYIEQSLLLNAAFPNDKVIEGRQRAQAIFSAQAFPTLRDEDWQYTKLTGFVQNRYEVLGKHTLKHEDLHCFLPPYAVTKVVFVDGWFSEELSDDLSVFPRGVSLESTRDVFEVPGATDKLFDQEEIVNQAPFGVLNSLLMADGYYLQVSANTTLETPVWMLYVQSQDNQMATVRNHIVLEENAEMTLVEQFVSLSKDESFRGCTNVVTEMSIAKSARMKQVLVQQQNHSSYYFNNQFVFQGDQSTFNSFYAGLGSLTSRHQNHVYMNGEHIESRQNSACLGRGQQTMDSRTHTQHNQVWGSSQQLHKYVLDDSAVGVFNGMIRVDQLAQKTDGQMDNKNLLLSTQAKMDCKPQLEIYADDVKCSHGSATGQINEAQIFYLQARGIPRSQAIEMITQAFLMEPAEEIANANIRQWVMATLADQLNAKDSL